MCPSHSATSSGVPVHRSTRARLPAMPKSGPDPLLQESSDSMTTPTVLFVCVHNAGRSQMAAGFLTHLAGDAIEVRSAGSAPAGTLNPTAVAAMAEVGI